MDKRETLRQVGKGVLNPALAGGLLYLLSHGAAEGRDIQPTSQVPPPSQGIVENLKGPMPSQQSITEQVRVLASQGETLRGQEGEQTAETLKKDILVSSLALDPSNPDRLYALASHPSRGGVQQLYQAAYDQANKKFTWQRTGNIELGFYGWALDVSLSILTVAGRDKNFPNKGWATLITKDGQIKYLDFPTIGAVRSAAFAKDGKTVYYSGNNLVETAGIVVKVDVASQTRVAIANNGLENMQEFGGPLLASPNNNETLYAVSGIEPAVLRTQDGSQSWEKLFDVPSPIYTDQIVVFNWQGKDALLVSGVGWLKMWQAGGQLQNLPTAGIDNIAVDTNGLELKIYSGSGTNRIRVGGVTSSSWNEFPTTGLPRDKEAKNLRFVATPDGKKWLTLSVYDGVNLQDSYGFWAYDLSQGETNGVWQQMVDGLEWKDPWPFKVYLPLLGKSFSGGW